MNSSKVRLLPTFSTPPIFTGTFPGSIGDLDSVSRALQGVYGVFVNTDGFTVGEKEETYLGLRIFELAKQSGTVKHYVWSSLDYMHKASMLTSNVTRGLTSCFRPADSNPSTGAATTTARDASPIS